MKKFVACLLILGILGFVVGCCTEMTAKGSDKYVDIFVTVDRCDDYYVVYDSETKVMYSVSRGSYNRGNFTLLVNVDGTPRIWEE